MTTTTPPIDTVVIGAGQAGLNMSRALQMADIDHVVVERGRVGETWASQRWDSFRLNTPNWANGLLGWDDEGPDPDGFMSAGELRREMIAFVEHFELPVEENTEVVRVSRRGAGDGPEFDVELSTGHTQQCRNVVICSGALNVPRTPALAGRITGTTQLHAAEYRRPDDLSDGGVLVVGGGQTGGQLAQELALAGRDTYLATSDVGSVPRRYRGRDIAGWMVEMGVVHTPVESLEDPDQKYATQPLMTGAHGGHTLTLHSLARDGVTLLGHLQGADGNTLRFDGDLAHNATKSISTVIGFQSNADQFIAATGIDAPAAEPDTALVPFDGLDEMCQLREIDLEACGIGTVIWATGFTGNFSYLDMELPVDGHGIPVHDGGAAGINGIWFCGLPWLRTQSSGLIYGSAVDAKAVAEQIATANAELSSCV